MAKNYLVDKDELIKQTILVLIISIVMGVIITVIDSAALQLVNWLMAILTIIEEVADVRRSAGNQLVCRTYLFGVRK